MSGSIGVEDDRKLANIYSAPAVLAVNGVLLMVVGVCVLATYKKLRAIQAGLRLTPRGSRPRASPTRGWRGCAAFSGWASPVPGLVLSDGRHRIGTQGPFSNALSPTGGSWQPLPRQRRQRADLPVDGLPSRRDTFRLAAGTYNSI